MIEVSIQVYTPQFYNIKKLVINICIKSNNYNLIIYSFKV